MSVQMKDSGVKWLGEVPEHWNVFRFKQSTVSCQNGLWGADPNGVDDIECVRVADFNRPALIVNPDIPTLRAVAQNERTGRLLKRGNLLIEKSGGGENQPVGQVVLYDRDASAICSNFVAKIELAPGMDPRFWNYQHHAAYAARVNVKSIKQTSGIQNLDHHQYLDEPAAFPSAKEQTAIADHLDRATSRIDTLVAKKTRFIELLQEEVISLATSCQAADSTRWIRLRHVSDIQSRPVDMQSGDKFTRLGLYNRGRGIFKKDSADTEDMGESSFHWVEDGDLILSGQFAWEGAVAMARHAHAGCVVSHRYPIVRGKPGEALAEYLYAYFQTAHGDMVLNDCSRGSAGRNRPLNMGLLMNWKIPIPPLPVQKRIATLLRKKERAEALQKRSIELLREHRTALITAAVTGKLDLRPAA